MLRELMRRERPSLSGLQEEMNRLFEHFYSGTQVHMTDWDKLDATPAVNVSENEKAFKVRVELAGLDPEDVDIEISDGYITLKGEKEEEQRDEGENYLRQEISYGSFYRTIPLPQTADLKAADASFKKGILTVTVPKKPEAVAKPKKLKINKTAQGT